MTSNLERIRTAEAATIRLGSELTNVEAVLHTAGNIAEAVEETTIAVERAGKGLRRLLPWVIGFAVVGTILAVVLKKSRRKSADADPSQPG